MLAAGSRKAFLHARREQILATLNKLGDRDTSQKGVSELQICIKVSTAAVSLSQRFSVPEQLQTILQEIDAETLPILVACLCSTGSEQRVTARKECVRFLGLLAGPGSRVQALVLQPATLLKIISHLQRRFQVPAAATLRMCHSPMLMLSVARHHHRNTCVDLQLLGPSMQSCGV